MKEQLGKNQSIARTMNNQLVLNELRAKPMSGTELASKLHLSNATVSSILRGLVQAEIIKICPSERKEGKGRRRIDYYINQSYGLVIVFSITSFHSHPVIANMLGETLYESDREIENYSLSTFEREIENVKEVLKRSAFVNVPVKSVVISLPGLVNQKTGKLQVSPQFDRDLFSDSQILSGLFEKAFSCPVTLENDTKLMMLAELSSGTFSKSESGLLAYVDYGIGGAFEFDGSLYWGARGYAGEIGRLVVKVDGETHHLDDFASIRTIQKKISEKLNRNVPLSELYDLYEKKDEVVVKEVMQSAKALGKAFKEIIRVFDVEQFVISGSVKRFGEPYLSAVMEEVKDASEDATLSFSELGNYAILDGGKELAISSVLSNSLKMLKNQ